MKNPSGFCQCGCGQKTKLSTKTRKSEGYEKGDPLQFIQGHSSRLENHPNWKGGKTLHSDGHMTIKAKGHPRAHRGYVREHILIAEKALGKSLSPKAVVHHHTPTELVLCEDNTYHSLLHRRQRAYEACGHANWRKCWMCQKYDDPKKLVNHNGREYHHRQCDTDRARLRYRKKAEK